MKFKLHIPTEQYGFIEAEYDDKTKDQIRDAVSGYREIKAAWGKPEAVENGMGMTPGPGLKEKEFSAIIDKYLVDENGINSEEYALMNEDQWRVVQVLKKAKARANYKLKK